MCSQYLHILIDQSSFHSQHGGITISTLQLWKYWWKLNKYTMNAQYGHFVKLKYTQPKKSKFPSDTFWYNSRSISSNLFIQKLA